MWEDNPKPTGRLIWLDVEGLPSIAWDAEAINKIGSKFSSVLENDNMGPDCLVRQMTTRKEYRKQRFSKAGLRIVSTVILGNERDFFQGTNVIEKMLPQNFVADPSQGLSTNFNEAQVSKESKSDVGINESTKTKLDSSKQKGTLTQSQVSRFAIPLEEAQRQEWKHY
nr:RNA-directed DNA polymerase, eukaryota, reverse transcriptase zinc-binding domain protein [Tanacetum cinerariifolium]